MKKGDISICKTDSYFEYTFTDKEKIGQNITQPDKSYQFIETAKNNKSKSRTVWKSESWVKNYFKSA